MTQDCEFKLQLVLFRSCRIALAILTYLCLQKLLFLQLSRVLVFVLVVSYINTFNLLLHFTATPVNDI